MIKIAIVGYGNLGKACERIAHKSNDFEVVGIFTRRDTRTVISPFGTRVYAQDDIESFADSIDVACICTGSANDVTELGIRLAHTFNTVDSFDTHARMREYFESVNRAASESGHLSFVGIGWDPGLFSLMRALFDAVLPCGSTQTFWGRGVSQGHSEALRRLDGVLEAKQYTVPKSEAVELARSGKGDTLSERDKHMRECYVVAEEGADLERIEKEIVTMPNYFAPYDTTVHFIGKEEYGKNHLGMAHAGFVLRSGKTDEFDARTEFSLEIGSNPDFTASVLMAYARANYRMARCGQRGAKTILDIPVAKLLAGDSASKTERYV